MPGTEIYRVPFGQTIQVSFFRPHESSIKVRNGEVIGGGWIGLSQGRSANLVLLKHGADDLYGNWSVCEIGISAFGHPAKLIGRFGITKDTVIPFGFKDVYFYDQIQHAAGGAHVFTYSFIDNVAEYFANLIHEALQTTGTAGTARA